MWNTPQHTQTINEDNIMRIAIPAEQVASIKYAEGMTPYTEITIQYKDGETGLDNSRCIYVGFDCFIYIEPRSEYLIIER